MNKTLEIILKALDEYPEYEEGHNVASKIRTNILDQLGLCHSCAKRKVHKEIAGNMWYVQQCNVCQKKLSKFLDL